jgi:hypothetical protein
LRLKCPLPNNEAKELFRVIQGGLGASSETQLVSDGPTKVEEEGRKRLKAAGVDRYVAREQVAGIAMPAHVKVFKLQVEFAITALSKLNPLPSDYMRDGYWPSLVEERVISTEATRFQR